MTQTLKQTFAALGLIAATLAVTGSAAAAPPRPNGMPMTAVAAQPAAGAGTASHAVGPQSDAQRYAERERATPQLAQFRGGDTIVIGASAVAVILAIVLIIVLI
jgi:hypothetical protein